jgi:hypothetical protein
MYFCHLAEVGGQMGLCLGASLLTAAEFVEFVVTAIHACCPRRKQEHRGNTNVVEVKSADNAALTY